MTKQPFGVDHSQKGTGRDGKSKRVNGAALFRRVGHDGHSTPKSRGFKPFGGLLDSNREKDGIRSMRRVAS